MDTKDIVDIYQLEAFCHHAVDHEDQSLLPLAFTEHARFDGRDAGGNGPLCEGIDAIVAFFALGKPPHPAAHHMTNCWVRKEESPEGRQGPRQNEVDGPQPHDRPDGERINDEWVVKTPDGWRIKERVARLEYPAAGFAG